MHFDTPFQVGSFRINAKGAPKRLRNLRRRREKSLANWVSTADAVLSILYPAKVALFLGESSLRGAWLTQGRLSLDLHTRRLSRVRCPHRLARICTTSRHKGTRSCCPCFPPFGFVVEHGCRQSSV